MLFNLISSVTVRRPCRDFMDMLQHLINCCVIIIIIKAMKGSHNSQNFTFWWQSLTWKTWKNAQLNRNQTSTAWTNQHCLANPACVTVTLHRPANSVSSGFGSAVNRLKLFQWYTQMLAVITEQNNRNKLTNTHSSRSSLSNLWQFCKAQIRHLTLLQQSC